MSNDDAVVIPLRTKLTDEQIVELLYEKVERSYKDVDEIVEEVNQEIRDIEEDGTDSVMAFGKLVQYVKELPTAQKDHLLAGALWKLAD